MDASGGPFDDWLNRPSAGVSTSLAEGLGIAVYVAEPGPHGEWLHVSPGVRELLGVSAMELTEDHDLWRSLVHPDDQARLFTSEVALDVGGRIRIEYRVIRPDGRVVWILDEAVIGAGPDGRALMDGYLVDVTSQRRAEQMLAAHAVVVERSTGRAPLEDVLNGLAQAVVSASSAYACVIDLGYGSTLMATRSDVQEILAGGPTLEAEAYAGDAIAGRVVLHYRPRVVPPEGDADVPSWAAGLVGLAAARVAERSRADLMYAQLAATLESTLDGIVVLGRTGRIIGHNTQFRDMWGIAPEALATGDDTAVLDTILGALVDPAAYVNTLRRLNGAEDMSADVLRTTDGRVVERSSRVLWMEGSPAGRVWSFRDVTETRRLQADLREREASLDRLVSQVRDYVIVNLDPEGRIASWNDGAARIIRYAEDQVLGRPASMLFPARAAASSPEEGDPARLERLVQRALAEGSAREEGWCLRQSGQTFWASTTLSALHDDDGRLRGFGLVMQDIGERREAQLALERRNRTLAAVGTIATAANSAASVGSALDTALLAVCEHSGWELAHVYVVDDDTGELRHDLWHLGPDVDRDGFAGFMAVTESAAPADLPLPAAVLAKGRTVWIPDLASLADTGRAPAGQVLGLVSGSGVPILVGDEPVGVLEFFSTEHRPFDAESDLVMRQLGTQLGRVVERERADRRAAEFARRTARLGAPAGSDGACDDGPAPALSGNSGSRSDV